MRRGHKHYEALKTRAEAGETGAQERLVWHARKRFIKGWSVVRLARLLNVDVVTIQLWVNPPREVGAPRLVKRTEATHVEG